MGRQAYPIIGGIIGAAVAFIATDGTATWQGYQAGFAIGAAIGGIAGSYIDPVLIQGNKIGDAQTQVAAEGGARAIAYGRACITATCIVARGNRKIVKKKSSNGKGSSGSTQNETVTWTFAIGLGEALIGSSITRIWQDENLVFDIIGDGAVSSADNIKFSKKFRFYDGNEEQLPDADLQVFLGEDTPYFRGTAYVVFPNFDLTPTSERVPTFKFEVVNELVGIIDDLETLEWDFPDPAHAGISSQSVTLSGSPGSLYDVDLLFTGDMETRNYAHVTAVVGAYHMLGDIVFPNDGRFITATDSAAASLPGANIYMVTISDPPQTYYVNNFLIAESGVILLHPDGSEHWKLSIKVAGDATVTYYGDSVDGAAGFGPQYGRATARITGINNIGNNTITLSSVISKLIQRVGIDEADFDVSVLDDQIAGVCIQESVTGADAINACVQPFFADPCERDGVLLYVKRGAPVVRTLTIDDLIEEPEVMSRENVIEYPAKVHFFYQSPITGYAMTKATSYRYSPQADSSGEGSVTAPVTFYESDTPAQIAAKLHKVMWTEAEGSFTWSVGTHCIDLVPTDTLGLFLRGIATRVRVLASEYDGTSIKLTMMKDRQSSYTSAVTGIPLPLPIPPDPTTMSKAVLAVLDIPALQDTDDALVYYTAMSGSTAVWSGGQLQRSLDGGATWTPIGEVPTDVTMGRLTVEMTAADREYTDTTNTVTVQLFDSANELVAYSDTTFHQEQGAIAVQLADESWEILQYRDVEDEGAGLWTLSALQRGRLNTVAGSHAVGALFVLLDTDIVKNSAQTAWLGGVMKHRAVSYGESAEDADIVTNTYVGRSQIEWSPASAEATYDGATLRVFNIVPRHRFGTEVNPIASANFVGYRVTTTTGSTTVTTDTTGTTAYVSCATPTSVTVAELNKFTGAGETITLAVVTVAAGSNTPEAIVNAGGGS